MSFVTTTLHQVAGFVTAAQDTEFNPDSVSPGPAGFIATAVFAAAVIVLGYLLVSRIRRNQYRHEVREQIDAELAGDSGTQASDAGKNGESRPSGA